MSDKKSDTPICDSHMFSVFSQERGQLTVLNLDDAIQIERYLNTAKASSESHFKSYQSQCVIAREWMRKYEEFATVVEKMREALKRLNAHLSEPFKVTVKNETIAGDLVEIDLGEAYAESEFSEMVYSAITETPSEILAQRDAVVREAALDEAIQAVRSEESLRNHIVALDCCDKIIARIESIKTK